MKASRRATHAFIVIILVLAARSTAAPEGYWAVEDFMPKDGFFRSLFDHDEASVRHRLIGSGENTVSVEHTLLR